MGRKNGRELTSNVREGSGLSPFCVSFYVRYLSQQLHFFFSFVYSHRGNNLFRIIELGSGRTEILNPGLSDS